MIHKRLQDITKSDVDELVEHGAREDRTTEYKAVLPSNSEHDKIEFLKDVCSFANASGGDILYGVPEAKDADDKHTGTPAAAAGAKFNANDVTLRLGQMILNGIAPRIPNVGIWAVDGFAQGSVLVVRVPRSWAGPHMVTYKHTHGFYSRDNASRRHLDVGDIRSEFALSEALPDRMRRFRDDRLAKIIADETPVHMSADARLVVHVLPAASFAANARFDLVATDVQRKHLGWMSRHANGRWNIDGFVLYSGKDSDLCYRYCQVFRNGCVEAVDDDMLATNGDRRLIPATACEEYIIEVLTGTLAAMRLADVPPPVVAIVSILSVKGFQLAESRARPSWDRTPVDRDVLLLPDVLVASYDTDTVVVLRPIFDAMWNAGGYARSENYDEAGNRKPAQ